MAAEAAATSGSRPAADTVAVAAKPSPSPVVAPVATALKLASKRPAKFDDLPVPKKARRATPSSSSSLVTTCHSKRLSYVYRCNKSVLEDTPAADSYDLDVVFNTIHCEHRHRNRGGIHSEGEALRVMGTGKIKLVDSPRHKGLEIVVNSQDGVSQKWHIKLVDGKLTVKTYTTESPFRTNPKFSGRRHRMLQKLSWLSRVLNVPLPLTGCFLARCIEELDHERLYCPGLPTVMNVVENVIPTRKEIKCLLGIPRASEMGDPESWIMAFLNINIYARPNGFASIKKKVRFLRGRVARMRESAWLRAANEMGEDRMEETYPGWSA